MITTDYFFEAARAITREHVKNLGFPDPFPDEPETELHELARVSLAHARALLDETAQTNVISLDAHRRSR